MNARRLILATVVALAALVAPVLVLGTSVAMADSCPNAAFRSVPSANLPDCRAYELVTPTYLGGFEVRFPLSPSASPDGSHLIGESLAGFAGSGNNYGLGTFYGFDRIASGWRTTPLAAPASQLPGVCNLNNNAPPVSQDAQKIVTALHTASQSANTMDLYLRQPDGTFTLIGPEFPSAATAGPPSTHCNAHLEDGSTASVTGYSTDLSHLLLSLQGTESSLDQWPGDTTVPGWQSTSLLEYVGTGNSAPRLVGVTGGSGSTNLISQCGTNLAAEFNPLPNAVSADGSTVFFIPQGPGVNNCGAPQPPAQELFARINGSQTVAISEPSAADCTACDTSSPADATFQAASADGSKAFFTTVQPLLGGDTTTNLYLYDFNAAAGQKVIRVSSGDPAGANVQSVASVSQDGSHVYFVAQGVLTTNPNNQVQTAQSGSNNLYVYERDAQFPNGRTAFIGALSASESYPPAAQTTPDGRFLVFTSSADLTPDDSSSALQDFRYDAQTGNLLRVSIGENGFNNNGNTSVNYALLGGPLPNTMSDDGSYVFFESSDALTPQAINDPTNTYYNVYEYHNGHVYLISDGQDRSTIFGSSSVRLLGTNASGQDVFFETADSLVPQDTSTQINRLYDARVGGGFPAGQGAPTCSGDACQRALSATPSFGAPGSATFSGPGNLTPPASTPVKPKTAAQVSAEKLAKALKACHTKRNRHKRTTCESQARKRYGPKSKSHKGGK